MRLLWWRGGLAGLLCVAIMGSMACADSSVADLALPDLEGKNRSLSEYRGRWVVVNYWATWCPPCREELPELEVFHTNREDAMVIGVNKEDISSERLQTFIEEQFLSYPILREPSSSRSTLGTIPGLPTTIIIDPEGRAIARKVGPVTAELLNTAIDRFKARRAE